MEENILDAIRKAFTDVEEFGSRMEKKPSESTFMNKNRQEIFSYLCIHPCSTLVRISDVVGMSTATVKWHIGKLTEKKFVSSARAGSKTVYYPSELIEPAHIDVLSSLNEAMAKKIVSAVLRSNGLSQKELCAALGVKHQTMIYNAGKLLKTGLIVSMKDGKFTRYYPSDIISRLRESSMRQVNHFRRNLLKMLRKDGVSPRIARTTYGELHVEVTRGGQRAILALHTDPFVTVLT